MAEPFSIAAGTVGVLSLVIQISQVAIKFGLDWKDAPKQVKSFRLELQSLQIILTEVQTGLLSNPAFQEAWEGRNSALLSHLEADHLSQDVIKESFQDCEMRLTEVVNTLTAREKSHRPDWERFKAPFTSKRTESAVAQLQRQCKILDRLISIDAAALIAQLRLDIKEVRKEHQEWHVAEENHEILHWLSQLNFEEKHRDILSKRHPGTGHWLLESDKFKAWRNGHVDSPSALWCPGIRKCVYSILLACNLSTIV